jgi:hypothetical protein
VLIPWSELVSHTLRLKSAFSRPDMFADVVLLKIRYGIVGARKGSLEPDCGCGRSTSAPVK